MRFKYLLIVLLFGVLDTMAMPITPRPLRHLIARSTFIVEVHVIKHERVNRDWNNDIAVLLVKDVVQGKVESDTIRVRYNMGLVCPRAANYPIGKDVLVFLNKTKGEPNYYSTVALHYGTKVLDAEGMKVYKQRIADMHVIEQIENKEEQRARVQEWLVDCASHDVTRWEGVCELSPTSSFMYTYDHPTATYGQSYELTEPQKKHLRKVALEITNIGYDDIALINLAGKKNDIELANYLVTLLNKLDTSESWYADDVMENVIRLTGRNELEPIMKKAGAISFADEDYNKKLQPIITEFVKAY